MQESQTVALPRNGIVIDETAYIAPASSIVGDVRIGPRASVWFAAVLRGDMEPIEIGAESNVQDGCVIHTDWDMPAILGERVTMGHGAIVHASEVHDETLIAMRATVLSGCVIGRHCLVGAGAVVPEGTKVPDGSLVLGVPGRVIRPLKPEEIDRVVKNAADYVTLGAEHKARKYPIW
jgi:carbonic anhydrase/acetyltransferase-like protein (isoleucine patch superfamily)